MHIIYSKNDIITALATPYGRSAVAVIRVSGKGCVELVDGCLKKVLKEGKLELNTFKTEKFEEKLMSVCFRAPKSYTGEDVVELFPHGNMTICNGIIEEIIKRGGRMAERGEFTKRAFLNGKKDLMQCEALADIIDAQTTEQLVYGNKRYDGEFKGLAEAEILLKTALSTVEAVLHYEDELEENEADEWLINDVYLSLNKLIGILESEAAKFTGGKIINDGFKVALIGRPNVGKSTLLNALTEKERAIVTPIAGTTRDTLDGEYIYKDRKFVITDTAGLKKQTDDQVETIGIERAKEAAASADAVVFLTDSDKFEDGINVGEAKKIYAINKCDGEKDVGTEYERAEKDGAIQISAKSGINIAALKQKLYDACPKDHGTICNHRQYMCVVDCLESCRAAKLESEKAEGLEIVAAALYDAYSAIAQLYGEQADEKILDSVFERFCVGK